MEKFRLINMTDFVLEVNKGNEEDIFVDYSKIINYAQFLKKPLNLGMFVPCDLEGNELTYPIYNTNHSDDCYCRKCEEETKRCESQKEKYEKAQERVLFKDINIIRNKENFFIIEPKKGTVFLRILKTNTKTNVESLFRLLTDIELTESGIKQFM